MSITHSRLADAVGDLGDHPNVTGAGLAPHPDHGRVLEVACSPACDAVPPQVLRVLVANDCSIVDVTPRGSPRHYVVTAV